MGVGRVELVTTSNRPRGAQPSVFGELADGGVGVRGQAPRPGRYRGGFVAPVVAVWDEDESAG